MDFVISLTKRTILNTIFYEIKVIKGS